jgi:hypothetical protein
MLLTNPRLDVSEAIGFLIVTAFIGILFYEKKLKTFLITGKIWSYKSRSNYLL